MKSTAEPPVVESLQEAVRSSARVLARGRGSKPALCAAPPDCVQLDVSDLTGVVDYDPAELTLTARAGTEVRELVAALAAEGQHLPLDTPFVESGATIGGTVASALSGPGRYGYGGLRDFLVGVRFVDGRGRLIASGGRVVKNAAGFDLAKLMVGSLGRLGILVELSFKVFPAPAEHASIRLELPSLASALEAVTALGRSPIEIEALELQPPGNLWVRLGGRPQTLSTRLTQVEQVVAGTGDRLDGSTERAHWAGQLEFEWAADCASLVRVPVSPRQVTGLDAHLDRLDADRRYGAGANLAWISCSPSRLEELHGLLDELGLCGIVLRGGAGESTAVGPRIGHVAGNSFAERVRRALDPDRRFPVV